MSIEFRGKDAMAGLPVPFLRTGFRPFFFGAAVFACAGVLGWIGTLHGAPFPKSRFSASEWHSHEMVFGYALAVVAGFFLTAVRHWSGGRETASGAKLAVIFALWCAGRLAGFASAALPWWIPAAFDLTFPVAVGVVIARPLHAAGRHRDLGFSAWLVAMGVLSGAAHVVAARGVEGGAGRISTLGLGLTLLLIVIIWGRVIPNFTRFHLKAVGIRSFPAIDWAAILGVGAVAVLAIAPWPTALGVAAIFAAIANLIRLTFWKPWRAAKSPMLFVLLIAYLWLPIGFFLRGWFALFGGATPSSATHALTIGALGTLTLGMMGWVGLAHTGRAVKSSPAMLFAYGSITIAAVIRVVGPMAMPTHYIALLGWSGVLWSAAFAAYLFGYSRALFSPAAKGGTD
ncbi:MAG: NnrS family protein [Deltaproteobacteria bacterium]|nr:NnrS family protein [Deltaproteobacteria bacterium]